MTTAPAPSPLRGRPLPPAPPTAAQVVLLQSVRSYPCVSVLLSTTPAPVMTLADAARLRGLVAQAAQRLRAEEEPGLAEAVVPALEQQVAAAVTGSTADAVAVYANRSTALTVRLPVAVRDRVVVDPTFATRDLVRALHRTPRHVVLLLRAGEARLFDGLGESLRPAVGSAFPMRDDREEGAGGPRRRAKGADPQAFFRQVDRALGTYLRLHPAPLVLAGSDRALAGFRAVSANLGRLAGTIDADLATRPLAEVAARTGPVLERYLLSRQDEALALLDRRAGAHRVVTGMPSAWLAARRERPEMLAVEQGLFYPARLSADGDLLTPATDVEHPDVLDDAVDELIELVLHRGGWVALVEDGALAHADRVALTLRGRG